MLDVAAVRAANGLKYEEGIAVAILMRAVLDVARGTPAQRQDAERFFASTWYADLCCFLDVEPERPAVLAPGL